MLSRSPKSVRVGNSIKESGMKSVFESTANEVKPFGMIFAIEASAEEVKSDENGNLYIETLDCGTSKTSNTQ